MKTIKLPIHNIIIRFDNKSGSIISSDLKEKCELCGSVDCYDCLNGFSPSINYKAIDQIKRKLFNTSMDSIESLILSHAIAGIDIESPAYLEGLEITIDGCINNIL